jgi:hypothetical protein
MMRIRKLHFKAQSIRGQFLVSLSAVNLNFPFQKFRRIAKRGTRRIIKDKLQFPVSCFLGVSERIEDERREGYS